MVFPTDQLSKAAERVDDHPKDINIERHAHMKGPASSLQSHAYSNVRVYERSAPSGGRSARARQLGASPQQRSSRRSGARGSPPQSAYSTQDIHCTSNLCQCDMHVLVYACYSLVCLHITLVMMVKVCIVADDLTVPAVPLA